MSIATNETDKQVGSILESIQTVTPEVAEQAVTYYRVMNSVWLGILAGVVLITAIICYRCVNRAIRASYAGDAHWLIGAGISGGTSFGTLLGCIKLANSLVHSFIAPQHYAAECIIELGRKAFGS